MKTVKQQNKLILIHFAQIYTFNQKCGQFKQNSIIRNMSLLRKSSKTTLRINVEDFSAAMDQKNSIIYTLQIELQALRPNQQKFLRIKQELMKIKSKHEYLIKDYERIVSNNADRLELSARNVQQLRIQAQHYTQELRLRGQALKQVKFNTQQLVQLLNKKQDESTECNIKYQEQKNNSEALKIDEQRTRIQICQIKQEVENNKKRNYLIRTQKQDVNQKCYKTQSYIRDLTREEASLNENLSKIEDQNQKLDSAISQLFAVLAVNQSAISDKQRDIQELTFNIASKQLQKKKIQNEIKQKIKQLSAEKQRSRLFLQQLEIKKNESNQINSHLKQACQQINFIYTKNHQIQEVNAQLRQDLKVCEKHRENVMRNNKILDAEIETVKEQSLKVISKLQQPFKNRCNNFTQTTTQLKVKWGSTSRMSDYQTGDFQRRTQRS